MKVQINNVKIIQVCYTENHINHFIIQKVSYSQYKKKIIFFCANKIIIILLLKDDFRNLFTASEKLKSEYRAVQEEYKNIRAEARRLKLTVTELQGELAVRADRITSLEVQMSKLSNQCDVSIFFSLYTILLYNTLILSKHLLVGI